MRCILLSIAVILASAVVQAAEPASTQLSVFTSNLGWAVSHDETTRTGGVGIALSRSLTPHWSAELKIAREQHYARTAYYTGEPPSPIYLTERFHEYPVDLLTRYRFPNGSRWTPYAGAGFRYVSAPHYGSSENRIFGNRFDLQVGVGTDLRITRHFGLRFDADRLVRSKDVFYDPLFRPSLGLTWRF